MAWSKAKVMYKGDTKFVHLTPVRMAAMGIKPTTRQFLARCKEVGYEYVGIGRIGPGLEAAQQWPFSENICIFTWPDIEIEHSFMPDPAIWHLVKEFEFEGATCGNSQSRQVDLSVIRDTLNQGYYELRDGDWWLNKDPGWRLIPRMYATT